MQWLSHNCQRERVRDGIYILQKCSDVKNKMAQIFYYEIPEDFEEQWDEFDEEMPIEIVQQAVLSDPNIRYNIRRGDILRLEESYRNNATFVWDGNAVVPLASEPDEYGNLPPDFLVLDPNDGPAPGQIFELDHWLTPVDGQPPIEHNDYVWIRLTNQEVDLVKSSPIEFDEDSEMYMIVAPIRGTDFYFVSENPYINNWDLYKTLVVSATNRNGGNAAPDDVPVVLVDQ